MHTTEILEMIINMYYLVVYTDYKNIHTIKEHASIFKH